MHADGLPSFSENVLCGSVFVVVSGVIEIRVADLSCVVVLDLAVVVGVSELVERLMAVLGDKGVVAKLLLLVVVLWGFEVVVVLGGLEVRVVMEVAEGSDMVLAVWLVRVVVVEVGVGVVVVIVEVGVGVVVVIVEVGVGVVVVIVVVGVGVVVVIAEVVVGVVVVVVVVEGRVGVVVLVVVVLVVVVEVVGAIGPITETRDHSMC